LVEIKPIYKMHGIYIKIALTSSKDILAIHRDASEANPTIKLTEDNALNWSDADNDTPVVEELSDGQPDHCKPKYAAHSRRG
jgi:hypothetical protein